MIKGLLLDFYGTVVEDDDAIILAISARVAAQAARPVTPDQVVIAWMREFDAVASGPGFLPLRECAPLSLATVMAEVGCAGDPFALCAPQFAYWRSPPLRAGTREFLARMDRERLPICIVSDVDRDDLTAAMAHHELTFDAVVTSEEVGAHKPSPAMFARALDALSLDASEVLHVGDSLNADLRGAHAAGIRVAWVNRRRLPTPDDLPIAYEIANLAELANLIG